jgi:hypothetical protein
MPILEPVLEELRNATPLDNGRRSPRKLPAAVVARRAKRLVILLTCPVERGDQGTSCLPCVELGSGALVTPDTV